MLVVDVSEARIRPGELFTHHLRYAPEPGDLNGEAKLVEPATVKVQVTCLKGVFWVDTEVRMRFRLQCARCLEPFEYHAEIRFSEEYNSAKGANKENPDQSAVINDHIDLTGKVRDAIIGSVPMRALCRDDCPGLCARCGASLAEGPCRCTDEEIDPRMEGLARLLEGYKKKGVE